MEELGRISNKKKIKIKKKSTSTSKSKSKLKSTTKPKPIVKSKTKSKTKTKPIVKSKTKTATKSTIKKDKKIINKLDKTIDDKSSKLFYNIKPIKIIFKYNNYNKKVQYQTYIYVGSISLEFKPILEKIENLNLYDTLITLNEHEIDELVRGYGEMWISCFFNVHHISYFINKYKNNDTFRNEIFKNYNFIDTFIDYFEDNYILKKIQYSYPDLIKQKYKVKMGKMYEKIMIEHDDIENLEFTKNANVIGENLLYQNQLGGDNNAADDDYGNDDDIYDDINEEEFINEHDITNEFITDYSVELTEKDDNELELEEIEKLYESDDVDENITKTNSMLKNIFSDNSIINNKDDYLIPFDTNRDNDIDSQPLNMAYTKKFVYNQYIYCDDTIKSIKNKIACSIKNNEKFGENAYLIPSRTYIWSEYVINGEIKKLMLEYKWLKKNELFDINVEPLPLNYYENMDSPVNNIHNIMKRFSGRIKRENEDDTLYSEYEKYIMNNEIYMIDIYNELDVGYSTSHDMIQNLQDVYLKLYFPKISNDEFKEIIDFLNDKPKYEENRIKNVFDTLYNDILIENEVTDLVEYTKLKEKDKYEKIFNVPSYITYTTIHINLDIYDEILENENKQKVEKIKNKKNKILSDTNTINLPKLDLFRIFNDFVPDDVCPFIQYYKIDGEVIFKYSEDYMYEFSKNSENMELLTKWFNSTLYGLSFKIKIEEDKFITLFINEIGKIEYKTQWKESEEATFDCIKNTYNYVIDLIKKINVILIESPRKISIKIPLDEDFKFAFINCSQKFKIHNDEQINHNDLSNFCRLFYPYVMLIIEPKKRTPDVQQIGSDKSKYGTYLKYKRVSKFDNENRIEQIILLYLKNYSISNEDLVNEITVQFNITDTKAKEEISKVKSKFPLLAKSNKISKKLKDIPKFKLSGGVAIDIHGKTPDKYKIKISGIKNEQQKNDILIFMNILLYLYVDTYITKNTKREELKNKLDKLINVAKRRSKVDDFINYKKDVKEIKQMTQMDKKRLGFSASEGHQVWSRMCQNSGKNMRRHPAQTFSNNVSQLIKNGYKLNKQSGEYEKKVVFKKQGEVILKTIKMTNHNKQISNGENDVYYSCDPENNGTHMYVGFLTHGTNPFNQCMPCCFKKNPFDTKRKDKVDFYKKCLGATDDRTTHVDESELIEPETNDILYILQDISKLLEYRLGYLSKFLNNLFNVNFNKNLKIKNHSLIQTEGYMFKFGVPQVEYSFINTLSIVLNMTVGEIKKHIIDFLKKDTDEVYYYSLNDGDIRLEYRLDDFIRLLQNSPVVDFKYLKDLIKIKGLFTKNGIFPIILEKITNVAKNSNSHETQKISEDYLIYLDKSLVTDYEFYLNSIYTQDLLFLINDGKYYYPIVEVTKNHSNDKNIKIKKLFNYSKNSFVENIVKYFKEAVSDVRIDIIKTHISAKETNMILDKLNHNDYIVKYQVIDTHFKCKYLITNKHYIIPVIPSGIINDIPFVCFNNINNCHNKIDYLDLEKTNKYLDELYKLTDNKLKIKPVGVFYDKISKKNMIHINGVITMNDDMVPIKNIQIPKEELDKKKIIYKNMPLYYNIDKELEVYDKQNYTYVDDRIKYVNLNKYKNESYELFKFELSHILENPKYSKQKKLLNEYIDDNNISEIQDLILSICSIKNDEKITEKNLGENFLAIIDEPPDLTHYSVKNQRNICSKLDQNKCNSNVHCAYENKKCKFSVTIENLIDFIQKLTIEITENKIKKYELLKERKYSIPDIVDYNIFTEHEGQKIIKSSNININKTFIELFNKKYSSHVGMKYKHKDMPSKINIIESDNILKDIKDAYLQKIIPHNFSIIRAFINGFYWIKHDLYDITSRNLGYYSDIQNEFINIFRSSIVDWLNIPNNIDKLNNLSEKEQNILNNEIIYSSNDNKLFTINNYIIKLMESTTENNLGLFELFILNDIYNIPIIILFNNNLQYVINNGIKEKKSHVDDYFIDTNIVINLIITQKNLYPENIEIIYYK